jgi:amino acid transporter
MGLEMSAVHAGDVRNPQKHYPQALFWSVGLILLTLILGSLAIAIIVPPHQLAILTGLTDAYVAFFNTYHLQFLSPIMIMLIIIGGLCSISTWVIGPTRGLLIATLENQMNGLPSLLKTNRFGAPTNLLLLQGILVSLLAGLFILVPTINEAYWLLSVMTAQLAVLFYALLFLAALRLRYKETHRVRFYRIPGGNFGIWLITCLGLLACLLTFIIGFFPPTRAITISSLYKFDAMLVAGIIALCLPLCFIMKGKCTAPLIQNKMVKK